VAEQLARLGVRRWTLVDPDRVEISNLNRLPAATRRMARLGLPKTAYVTRALRRFWGDEAEIAICPVAVEDMSAAENLADCDWILAATDDHASRLACQELARTSGARLLSLGSLIDVDADGLPRALTRVCLPPADWSWCLVCARAIDPGVAARERAAGHERGLLLGAGYLDGVAAPAVFWLNSLAASLGVSLVHRAACGDPRAAEADWMIDAVTGQWHILEHTRAGCWHCVPGADSLPEPEEELDLSALSGEPAEKSVGQPLTKAGGRRRRKARRRAAQRRTR
jgi:molybdopterin-synthase adenylyltransferase